MNWSGFLFCMSLCNYNLPFTIYVNANKYTLVEQQQDHFQVALRSYQGNDDLKSIRIFEFLSTTIRPKTSLPCLFSILNLAIIHFERQEWGESLRWSKQCQSQATDILCRFYTAVNLFLLRDYMSSFMVYRHITIPKRSQYEQYNPTIKYNMGIILYKIGAGGDEYFEEALKRIGLPTSEALKQQQTKYKTAKQTQGIDFTIEWGPVIEQSNTVFTWNGDRDCARIIPLNIQNIQNIQNTQNTQNRVNREIEEDILSYYFMPDSKTTDFPLPHQLAKHFDQNQDTFTQSERVPKIVVSMPRIDENHHAPYSAPLAEKECSDYFSFQHPDQSGHQKLSKFTHPNSLGQLSPPEKSYQRPYYSPTTESTDEFIIASITNKPKEKTKRPGMKRFFTLN